LGLICIYFAYISDHGKNYSNKFFKNIEKGSLHLFCANSGDASWPRLSPMQQNLSFPNGASEPAWKHAFGQGLTS